MVLGKAVPVSEFGILLEKVPAVGQQDLAQFGRGFGTQHAPGETVFYQQRQIPGMIQVRMRQHNRIDARRIDWEWLPIAQPKLLETLEQAAVDQDAGFAVRQQILGTGNRADAAQKRDEHLRLSLSGVSMRSVRRRG